MLFQAFRIKKVCVLCHHLHDDQNTLCHACLRLFTPLGAACTVCAMPLVEGYSALCGQCLKKKPMVDHVIVAYRFEEPLRTLLHEFKYHEGLYLTHFFIQCLVRALPTNYHTDCFMPIPIHRQRLQQRGYNQAALLAKGVSHALHLPYDASRCKKIINTPSQTGLDAPARQKNVRHSFQARSIHEQHITLVDDLMTTGHTANEVARTLKEAGAQQVNLLCCARAF